MGQPHVLREDGWKGGGVLCVYGRAAEVTMEEVCRTVCGVDSSVFVDVHEEC
jgi:hypothetical protein